MMSMFGPTASRMPATACSAASTGALPSMALVGGTAMDLNAEYPSATAWRAKSANRLAFSTGVS